ncbi:MAG TPA: protein kinase [Nodularia sp. (in: cyanobacteria)]|nr:protein kinase [Nodularia sp. (in: cyanobacteria)]
MNGQILDERYQILKVLNVEEVVQTYLVEDATLPGSQLIIKQLHPGSDNLQQLTNVRRLFAEEAKKLQQLGEEHDQIQNLVNYFEYNEEFYLVQEYIIGNNLTTEICLETPLQEQQVISVLSEVLEILVFVHSRGVIHQDIKPANIIRRESDKKLVLVDFGGVQEVVTTIVGNLEYVPVEQLRGDPQYNSDIYALGIVAIAALIGLPANEISRLQNQKSLLTGEIIWRTKNIIVSKELAKIIDKMVRFNYRKRYQSVTEVLNDLQQLKIHQYTQQKQLQLKLWLILAGIVSFLGLVTATWWFQSRQTLVTEVNFEQLYQEGLRKYQAGDYQAAIENFTQAIAINSKYGLAYYNRGVTRAKQGNTKGAIADFQQAVNLFRQSGERNSLEDAQKELNLLLNR